MKIAIIGAGLAGLSCAFHLKSHDLTVFDPKGIGGGASGIATGLMHPYAGEQGRRSQFATEAMQAAQDLIQTIETATQQQIILHRGLIRHVQNDDQRQMFLSHAKVFGDVRQIDEESFWIESGLTIDCPLYLALLWQVIADQGAILVREKITDLNLLADFDQVIIAAGAGVRQFPELSSLPISVVKGQVLSCQGPPPSASTLGKGYIALSRNPQECFVGSTYERDDMTENPDAQKAKELLFDKIGAFFPAVNELKIAGCKAALRVVRKGHYFPIVDKIKDNLWVVTALGSRGLLYHAYLGRQLAEKM